MRSRKGAPSGLRSRLDTAPGPSGPGSAAAGASTVAACASGGCTRPERDAHPRPGVIGLVVHEDLAGAGAANRQPRLAVVVGAAGRHPAAAWHSLAARR